MVVAVVWIHKGRDRINIAWAGPGLSEQIGVIDHDIRGEIRGLAYAREEIKALLENTAEDVEDLISS